MKILTIPVLFLLSGPVIASTEETPEAPEKEYSLKGNFEFGLERNEGNTNSSDIDFRSFTELGVARWTHQLTLSASNEEAEGTRTEEEYKGTWKALYNYRPMLYVFSNLEYEKDRIAGYDFEANETIGLGWTAIKTEKHELVVEAGAGYRHDRFLDERAHDESYISYGDLLYKVQLSETTSFSQHFNVKASPDKTVALSETGLTSKLNDRWSLKISYEFEHTDEVPEGTEHADETTKIGLVFDY